MIAPMVCFSDDSLMANYPTTTRTDESEQNQRTSSVAQRLAVTAGSEAKQSQRTSFVAQYPVIIPD